MADTLDLGTWATRDLRHWSVTWRSWRPLSGLPDGIKDTGIRAFEAVRFTRGGHPYCIWAEVIEHGGPAWLKLDGPEQSDNLAGLIIRLLEGSEGVIVNDNLGLASAAKGEES